MCRRIGEHGLALLTDGARVLTHCNAGALATGGIGTALAPVYVAAERGWRVAVFADETRPLMQGSRLTAWELSQAGIDVTVLADNMAASLMRGGSVDVVIVGADRIAANGDVANKIGTYPLALAARHHGIPFYVAAPWSTVDPATRDRRRDRDRAPCGRRAGSRLPCAGVAGAGRDLQSRLRRHAGRARDGVHHRPRRDPPALSVRGRWARSHASGVETRMPRAASSRALHIARRRRSTHTARGSPRAGDAPTRPTVLPIVSQARARRARCSSARRPDRRRPLSGSPFVGPSGPHAVPLARAGRPRRADRARHGSTSPPSRDATPGRIPPAVATACRRPPSVHAARTGSTTSCGSSGRRC